MKTNPPKWADQFLCWFCNPELLEDLQGDLYEIFDRKLDEGRRKHASFLFVWLVFRSFRWSVIQRATTRKNSIYNMTWINFKIALRVLMKDRLNTALNLTGLTIGIACFLLLGLYVKQELAYDQFHSKKDRIYRSWLKEDYGEGKTFFSSFTPLRFESLFETEFPEIETAVQMITQQNLVGRGENRINEPIAIVSPEFFEVFDFTIISGNKVNPINGRNDLAISENYAEKYFGTENPIGKTLAIQFGEEIRDFNVNSVFKNLPIESSIKFDLAISNEINNTLFSERVRNEWYTIIPETFILLKENSDISSVNEKIQDVVMSKIGDEVDRGEYNIGFQPLTDIHLNPDIPSGSVPAGNPQYILILGLIGVLVLIIACINYTTIAVGQSIKRTREVGIRKVLGARKITLIGQYMSESILLALTSMAIGTVITYFIVPIFNQLAGTEIVLQFTYWHIMTYLLIGITIGLVAGSYPSLILSGFKVINNLKGGSKSSGNTSTRKGLVVFQFLVTVFLISTTIIMRQQINFLQAKDLGYQYEAVLAAQLIPDQSSDRLSQFINSGYANGQLLKSKLEKHPEISNIAMGSHVFGTSGWARMAFTDDQGAFRKFRLLSVDSEYLNAFNIKIKEGRNFESDNGLDQRQSVILNQTAAEYFGLTKPIGAKLPGKNFGEHRIIGVTDDFHFSSLHSKIEPLVIVQNVVPILRGVSDTGFGDSLIPKITFTYSGANLANAARILEKEWGEVFKNEKCDYHFINDRINAQYESEIRTNTLISIATVLSIIIASLGLLGLTLLIINNKEKEISIRKVMGASPLSIFKLLAKGFSVQLLISIFLSIPITILLMNKWLENFAYSISIGAGVFLISGFVSMLLAALVITYHTIKAASVNPANSLRSE
ncbi:MAG: ABC transporter permease [Bacteroidota bacterium]